MDVHLQQQQDTAQAAELPDGPLLDSTEILQGLRGAANSNTRYMNPTVSAFSWESGLEGGAVYRCKHILAARDLRSRITGMLCTPRLPPALTVINRPIKFTPHTINLDSCIIIIIIIIIVSRSSSIVFLSYF